MALPSSGPLFFRGWHLTAQLSSSLTEYLLLSVVCWDLGCCVGTCCHILGFWELCGSAPCECLLWAWPEFLSVPTVCQGLGCCVAIDSVSTYCVPFLGLL